MPAAATKIFLGYALDLVVGEPPAVAHPVCWMGKLVDLADWAMPGRERGMNAQRISGAIVALGLPAGTYILTKGLLRRLPRPAAALAETALLSAALAPRSLYTQAGRVEDGIVLDIDRAREAVSHMVGRDTEGLDGDGIVRAAVESVAENANDGVVAPLFYGMIGGAPLALAYKMVNTLDSMIGYRDEQYRHFGGVAARLDDVAGFIPARLSAAAAAVMSPVVGGDPRSALAIWHRDAALHDSPNAGVCESAYAGALQVRLGGADFYSGMEIRKSAMGGAFEKPGHEDIGRAAKLMYASAGMVLAAGVVARMAMAASRILRRGRGA